MKKWKLPGLGLIASLALTSSLHAQLPGVPAPPAAPAIPADPAAVAPAAPTNNLWSFFCPTDAQCARCKALICNSPLGDMLKGAAGPVSLMSGGLIGGKCGTPTAADLAKLAQEGKLDGAVGTAAQIKKSEAEAKARREAIRYLGTVDCTWWPEARDALIAGLRTDPNECVRYEAALALLHGCCCNKKTMEALKDCVNGTEKFGKKECSWRVRDTANAALGHCAAIFVEVEEAKEQKKQLKEGEEPTLPPPAAHGKGLVGIFANASVPPNTSGYPKNVPMATKEPLVNSATPTPMYVVQQPEKKGLLQRLGSSGNNVTYQTNNWYVPEKKTTIPVENPITPATYRPMPQTPAPKASLAYPSLADSNIPEIIIPQSTEASPLPFRSSASLQTQAPKAAVANTTPTNVSTARPVVLPTTPAVPPVIPSRGIVIMDENGVR